MMFYEFKTGRQNHLNKSNEGHPSDCWRIPAIIHGLSLWIRKCKRDRPGALQTGTERLSWLAQIRGGDATQAYLVCHYIFFTYTLLTTSAKAILYFKV